MSLEQLQISKTDIDSFLSEQRVFPPPPEFAKRAHINSMEEYRRLYEEARKNPEAFWTARGREELYWQVPFTEALEWNPPHAKWFLAENVPELAKPVSVAGTQVPNLSASSRYLWLFL